MNEMFAPRVVRGRMEQASYRDPLVPIYRDNPLLEALPPIYTAEVAYQGLRRYPEYSDDQRQLPSEIRLHLIYNANQFFKPSWVHLEIEQRVSRLIRAGYLARNPSTNGYWSEQEFRIQTISNIPHLHAAATGFNLVGISGIGKSTALEAVLRLYPQVIAHHHYKDHPFNFVQIVWLKLDCPFDGSVKGLCVNFFQEMDEILGTNYYQNYSRRGRASIDELLGHMKRLTALHGVGCMVIDEIQHLAAAKNIGVSRMLNFFVQLVNTMGMPVVLVGTYKALPLLTSEFRLARRASGQGDFVWERMQQDEVWQMFVEALWQYQYVRNITPLTPQLSDALYEVSQGITDFTVKAYLLSQMRAIATGIETVTPALIRSVAMDSFRFSRSVLEALRTNDWHRLKTVPDIQLVDLESHYQKTLAESSRKTVNSIASPEAGEKLADISRSIHSEQNETAQEPHLLEKPAEQPIKTWPADDLRNVIARAAQRHVPAYQALQGARIIRPATEFFATEKA